MPARDRCYLFRLCVYTTGIIKGRQRVTKVHCLFTVHGGEANGGTGDSARQIYPAFDASGDIFLTASGVRVTDDSVRCCIRIKTEIAKRNITRPSCRLDQLENLWGPL